MKKQFMTLLAVLLVSATAIALTTLPGLNAFTYYTATFVVSPEGAGTVNPTSAKVLAGSQTSNITATANAGYSFEGWYDGETLLSTENPHKFTLSSDITITAKFKQEAAHVVLGFVKPGCEGMGTVSVSPAGTPVEGGYKYNHGTQLTLKASAAKGHEFVRWENGGGTTLSTVATYSFTLNGDLTVYAVFKVLDNYKDDLVAFPGAEGYGRFTTGGRAVDSRGSKVYYVTRLDDCADNNLVEGTLRWALKTGDDTPRTVLFKVSGTIYLTSTLSGVPRNVTIAGQTAPGGGICIAGYQMKLPSNSIVRHIRFRTGDLPNKSMSPLDVENIDHVVIDHCSFTWSMEENITLYDCDYTTTQWCIFAEGLYYSKNVKGQRSYGAQWGGEHGTMHHCLFSNNNSRAPRFNGVRKNVHDRHVDDEFVNNVVYNWGGHNSIYGGECDQTLGDDVYSRTFMINNYYRPGPATKDAGGNRHFVSISAENESELGQWYLSGNKFELSSKWAPNTSIWKDEVLKKVNADNYYGFTSGSNERGFNLYRAGTIPLNQTIADKVIMKEIPYALSGMSFAESADEAYQKVVKQAGASLPRYDEVDARILAEAAGTIDPQFKGSLPESHGSLGFIDTPYDIKLQSHDEFAALDEAVKAEIDVTCYPRLQGDSYDTQVVDTDGDGLPDAYETEVGLNPNDASDGQKLTTSGYSNLEIFLNGVADGLIDAKKYTRHQTVEMKNSFNAVVGEGEAYATVQAAIDAAPGDGTPYYIFIKKGTYEGHVQIDKPNIHLMGESKQNTVISWNKTNEEGGGVDKASTVNVTANDVSFDNLTLRNTRINEGQALALYTKADRIIITNCNLEGWQDTYRTGKDGQRHLVRNCKISGTTDFIYGSGEAYFDADTLHVLRESNVIVAPDHSTARYGYVFRNAVITAATAGSTTALGRPWGNTPKVSYINTRLTNGVSITDDGWNEMGGKPIQMAEYNTLDANGNAVDLSQRRTLFGGTASKAVLSKTEAVNDYKLDYVLRGSDNWDADWQGFILPAPEISVNGNNVSWSDPTGFAQCYLVIADGVATVTTSTSTTGSNVTVQCVSAYGVTGELASSANPTGISQTKAGISVVARQYFTAGGRQVQRLQHGLNIIRETLSDGTTRTVKVVAK